jgi:cytochrome c oxidase assembly protein subunit 11
VKRARAVILVAAEIAALQLPAPAASAGRTVSVRWVAKAAKGLPVAVSPDKSLVATPLGSRRKVSFKFTNLSGRRLSFRSEHAVAPDEAEKHLSKTVCFCFEIQTLLPRETKVLPVVYAVSTRLPADVSDIVVSYRLVPTR